MKKILIIQHKMIGDVLTSTFLCEVIKKQATNITVDYLINEHTYPVVQGNPYIDNVILFKKEDEKNILSLLSFALKIRKRKYDAIIDIYSKTQSNIITLLSSAKVKVSYKKWYTRWIYTKALEAPLPLEKNAVLYHRLDLLKSALSGNMSIKKPKIYLSKEEIQKGKSFLLNKGIKTSDTVFMISVLGSREAKTYPLPYMAEVIDLLAQTTNSSFLFNYTPSQFQKAQEVYDLCKPTTQKKILLNAYTESLRDFLCVLKHCNALIGNEGGAVNMAKALSIPTFSIYAPQVSKGAWDLFSNEKNIGVHIFDYQERNELSDCELYMNFKPNLFKEKLIDFVN